MEAKEERVYYIHGMRTVSNAIGKALDSNGPVQTYNQMAKKSDNPEYVFTETEFEILENLKRDSEQKALQLDANRFIVAVVGVSGSGKSVATNAIVVGKNLLPVDNSECTLAETEIRYDKDSRAVITFYTKEKFHKKVITTLKGINGFSQDLFVEAEEIVGEEGYRNFGIHFKTWVKENENYSLTAVGVKEILNITENIGNIWEYLDQNELELKDVSKDELKTYIADKSVSPAVKKIVIYSPILKEMKNAIFMDMPGIGTTTKSFSGISANAILNADAVLLVRRFNDPVPDAATNELFSEVFRNLKSEDEKRRFIEKIFLFLNQADLANVEGRNETPGKHLDILMESLNRNDIDSRKILEEHMVIGSALAFAPNDELGNSADKQNAKNALIEKGFYKKDDKTCIEIIREKLQNFNDTVRQKVRIEEAEAIKNSAVSILEKYQNQYIPEDQFDTKFRERFKGNLTKNLNNYAKKTADEYTGIQSGTAKSVLEAGAKALEDEKKNIKAEDPIWQKVRASELWDCDYSALPYDYYYRHQKQPKLKRVFENAIKNAKIPSLGVFSDNCTSILSVIQNCILDAMEVDADGAHYDELHEEVGKHLLSLDDETIKKANETKFDYGIYVNELFTLLITLPFHSSERWDYYNSPANRKLFETLDQAYAIFSDKNGNHQALIGQMLFHKTREEISVPYKNDLLNIIKNLYFREVPDDSKEMEIIEQIAVKKLDEVKDIVFREGELRAFLESFEKDDKNQPPRSFTCMHYKREINYNIDESDESKDKLDDPSESKILSKTEVDVFNEFTADLDVLIDALRNALPYCLLMEKETESTVKDLCNRISDDKYKEGLCDWIERPDIKKWILESKSKVSISRNRALKQVNEIYKDIKNWQNETTPVSEVSIIENYAPIAD